MKLALGIASYESIKVKTAMCLIATLRDFAPDVSACIQESCYVHWNRQKIVDAALKHKCSHLWFVDTDVVFPAYGLKRLIALNKDVAGGTYNYREEPPLPTVRGFGAIDDEAFIAPEEMPKAPFRCAVLPTGFMLIRLSVLEKIPPPYFTCEQPVGEDAFFSRKLRAAGVELWCDPTFKIGHIGPKIY